MFDKNNLNLGCVIYTLTHKGLEAEWLFNENNSLQKGIGVAKRLTKLNGTRKFEGNFEIVYTDLSGNESPKLELEILFKSEVYYLTWIYNEEVTDLGIGIESDDRLLVSYKKNI
ncbi:hypothetical protein [Tenacibaculum xiamenense]|uniref:hypothetical protein n=1 Tax=Tenacibaculum xiamenense TaxID=1261553 RepID=UPI00389358B5